MSQEKHALILGASGISGWALLNAIRNYPTPTTFSQITATTNRPLTLAQAMIPDDPRITLVNGIDFTQSPEAVTSLLETKIPAVNKVTHVFFTAYIHKGTFAELRAVNSRLIHSAISAISTLAPGLEAVILQTGGKHYGVEFADKLPIPAPLKESEPRIPQPYTENIFYYDQVDVLRELARDAAWTFTEVRPDVIVGFVPNDNAMDAARGVALYLGLQKVVHGAGAKIAFPGSKGSWENLHTDTFQDVLAKFEIHAALNQGSCGSKEGEAFNVADGAVDTWEAKWPRLCEYFGLEGVGPDPGADPKKTLLDFVEKNKARWEAVVKEKGLKVNAMDSYDFNFLYFVMVAFDFDRQYDLNKSRSVGFKEQIDTSEAFITAFERLKKAGVIPA